MKHEFAIVAVGPDPASGDFEDRFFEAGCGDATLSFQRGVIVAEFSRRAPSLAEALATAIADVARAGARVLRVEPDPLVGLSDIAERSGLTRQAISLYIRARRGAAFPHPVARATSKHPLWDWAEVAEWLARRGRVRPAEVARARLIREANRRLETASSGDDPARRLDRLEAA